MLKPNEINKIIQNLKLETILFEDEHYINLNQVCRIIEHKYNIVLNTTIVANKLRKYRSEFETIIVHRSKGSRYKFARYQPLQYTSNLKYYLLGDVPKLIEKIRSEVCNNGV